ncbi:MAG: hypothetical protein JNG86_03610 [Verrucomicrobiaceae bacterium]|nr:hypothetical protein [Verrucomicrobiaceae bacterium]
MSLSPKRKGVSLWTRVEQAGQVMETGVRLALGLLFACLFAAAAWWAGCHVWVGAGFILAVAAFPPGFLVGFFWLEVKFLLHLILRVFIG